MFKKYEWKESLNIYEVSMDKRKLKNRHGPLYGNIKNTEMAGTEVTPTELPNQPSPSQSTLSQPSVACQYTVSYKYCIAQINVKVNLDSNIFSFHR